jgi:hypothetical protein
MSCRFCGAGVAGAGQPTCIFCAALPPVSADLVIDLLRQVDQRFDQAEQTLHSQRRKEPTTGTVGWYHHLDASDKVGISSTAYALKALSLLSPRDPDLLSVAEGILDHPNRLDLGIATGSSIRLFAWPMQSRPDVPLVEPTCYVLQQLLEAGLLRRDDVRAVGALEWILAQQLYEHAWGPSSAHSGSVYVTALVCQVLRAFGYAPGQAKLDGALKWLFGARNDDGGWGKKHRDGESNAWCTSHALMALHDRGQISPEPNSVPGVSWLRANANSWSSLISEEYFVHSPSLGKVDVRYEFQPLPLVLIALDHAGIRPLAPDVFRATDDLLRHERDGVWIWPSSSRKTIFNLCHSVQAMMAVRERFNHAESIRAMLALRSIDEKAVSSRTLEQSNWSFKDVTSRLGLNWRRYSAGALGIFGMTVMLTILMPTGSFEAIWNASSNALIKVTQSPNLSAAAAVAIGVAATVLWRWRLMWLVGYLGLVMTLYLYLKQGEGGVLSVVGSIAATLVTLGAVFWLQKREK